MASDAPDDGDPAPHQEHRSGSSAAFAVHFFVDPSGVSIERLRELDPDREWTDMRRAKERWVVPAYAWMKRFGHQVSLGTDVPAGGMVVYHKEDHRAVLQRARGAAARSSSRVADFRSADEAEFEVVQNGHYADGRRCFFMPPWPQPGLIPRNRERWHAGRERRVQGPRRQPGAGGQGESSRVSSPARACSSSSTRSSTGLQSTRRRHGTITAASMSCWRCDRAWHASTRTSRPPSSTTRGWRGAGNIVARPGLSRAASRTTRLHRSGLGRRSPGGAATPQVGSRSLRGHGR